MNQRKGEPMHYKYMYAKHIDAFQKEILSVHDMGKLFLADIERITKQAQIDPGYHQMMLTSMVAILNSASKIVAEIQNDLYEKPPTVPTDDGGVLFVKDSGAGKVLTTTEPEELQDFDDTEGPRDGNPMHSIGHGRGDD